MVCARAESRFQGTAMLTGEPDMENGQVTQTVDTKSEDITYDHAIDDDMDDDLPRPQAVAVKDMVMWVLLGVFGLLSLYFLYGLVQEDGKSDQLPFKSSTDTRSTTSHPPDLLGQDWIIVDKPGKTAHFENPSQTVRLPARIVAFFESVPKHFSRREFVLSARVSMAITVVAGAVVLGCTGLAAHAGFSKIALLNIDTLKTVEQAFSVAAYASMSAFILAAVFALVVFRELPAAQIGCTIIGLIGTVAVFGAMISQLILRAQDSAFPNPEAPQEPQTYGKWLIHFGLGGVMAFSSGAFACMLIMFAVEMILFNTRGTWQEPVLTSIALPAAFLYNLGNRNMSVFQYVIKVAILIRLGLYLLGLFFPNIAALT